MCKALWGPGEEGSAWEEEDGLSEGRDCELALSE